MKQLILSIFLSSLIPLSFADDHIMKRPNELEWKDGPASLPAGSKVSLVEGDPSKPGPFTLRLQLPPNYKIPPHWHPAIEHITVLDGEFAMGTGEKFDKTKATILPRGGIAVMPIKFKHYAFTSDKLTTIQLHGIGPWDIIYVNPSDDPRKMK